MAQLRKLAVRHQQALDGLSSTFQSAEADSAGSALAVAVAEATTAVEGVRAETWTALEPVIMHTKLATSIVAYFERIPWGTLTTEMLCRREGSALAALNVNREVLTQLFASALRAGPNGYKRPLAAELLQQVYTPAVVPHHTPRGASLDKNEVPPLHPCRV